VSTLPLNAATSRSGRVASRNPPRRGLSVPMTVPEPRSATPCLRRAATASVSFLTMPSSAMISSIMMAGWTPGTCRHEVTWGRLVTGREANHSVELRAFDCNLNVVHDQIAARKNVPAIVAGTDDEIAGRGGANLKRKSACLVDSGLHYLCDTVQVTEADGQFRRAVHHGNLRLAHILIRKSECSPLRAPHGLSWRSRFQVAAQRFPHYRPPVHIVSAVAILRGPEKIISLRRVADRQSPGNSLITCDSAKAEAEVAKVGNAAIMNNRPGVQ